MDSAHTEYDAAVRHLAETEGFAAFGSVIPYGTQNMRQKQFKPTTLGIKPGKKHVLGGIVNSVA